jgi:hypothetical protein
VFDIPSGANSFPCFLSEEAELPYKNDVSTAHPSAVSFIRCCQRHCRIDQNLLCFFLAHQAGLYWKCFHSEINPVEKTRDGSNIDDEINCHVITIHFSTVGKQLRRSGCEVE